jgi:Tol biopolymer transport system component
MARLSKGGRDVRSLTRRTVAIGGWAGLLLVLPILAHAQYFGKNTVRHETFDFRVLRTAHFDIYYYDETAEHIDLVAQMAERWNTRLSEVLGHQLTGRQPIIMYASHPHFRQTNASPADIGEGTGGFTEIFRNRIVMPFGGTIGETDHVLGHELVHAFQFDMTGRAADPERFGNIPGAIRLPLWLVEGMAEYLSVGPQSSLTAMWLRDLVARDISIDRRSLRDPRFQPYRHGHAFMAYVGGRFGDRAVARLLVEAAAARENLEQVFELALDVELEQLLDDWERDMREHYGPMLADAQGRDVLGRELRSGIDERDLPAINLAPALSPDGRRLVYLAQPQRLRLEMYLMDVETGEVLRRVTRMALDPHFEALQFVRSAGDWSPDGERFVFAGIRRGQPVLEILDAATGRTVATHAFPDLGEMFNPAWSPDARRIAFTGMRSGLTDLYVFDLESGTLERLTDDVFSALQPAFAPDGNRIAFVTDRFVASPDEIAAPHEAIALIDPETRAIERVPGIPDARHTNPRWSADGDALYFLADARGTSNIYRVDANGDIFELTNVQTGISGLTALSPALSVAGPRDSLAFTLFHGGGFSLMLIDDGSAIEGTRVTEITYGPDLALLPPVERREQRIAGFLDEPARGLPRDPIVDVRDYQARIRPEFISQAGVGGGTGAFGTYFGGGISLHWSDMLGDHNVLTQLQAEVTDGEILNNTAAVVGYQNRVRRFDWGAVLAQLPLTSGSFGEAVVEVDGEPMLLQRVQRFWEINRMVTGRVAYPFSRAMRLEFESGYRHITFDARERTRMFSLATGERVLDEQRDIASPDSLRLGNAATALVYDTSIFGGTSPVLGQRARIELSGVAGTVSFLTPLMDYRAYWMPFEERTLTVAGRVLHFGRYGGDAEDPRLRPLFLGSPNLVRGYAAGFGVFADAAFDRLQGSRIAVANVELRFPITGVRGFVGGPFLPPVEAAAFFDAGAAWGRGQRPEFLGGDQPGVSSYGVGIRTNLGGLVLNLSYVNPVQLDDRGWHWQFSLTPGF